MSDTSSTSSRTGASPQVSVIFNGRVQADIDLALARQSPADGGGVLVGTADPVLGLVVVLGSEPLPPDAQTSRSVEFTPASWAHMIDVVIERHPGQRIVGWYHAHAGSGVFLSGHDLLIHTTFFSQPWQVAYVVDPTRDERGLFAWRGQQIARIEHWDVTSGATGVATSVAPNEPEGRAAVLSHLAQPVSPRAASAVPSLADESTTGPPSPKIERDEDLFGAPEIEEPTAAGASSGAPTWGYPLGQQAEDDTLPADRPTPTADADDDLDAWIASLPTTAEAGAAAFAAFDGPAPRTSTHAEVEALASSVVDSRARPRRRFLVPAIAAAIIAAIVIAVVVTSGSDDDRSSPTTTSVPVTVSTVTVPATTTTAKATTTAAPTTESTARPVATDPPTSSTLAPTTAAPTTTTTPATLPATPNGVASPSARIGSGSIACPAGSDGLFAPVANCFVALPNGNIVADFDSDLVCVDPPGTVLAEAIPFLVGFGGDPLAVIANGVVLPRCDDLSYAKNVMAGGAPTLPGLCGNNNTTINQNSTRCFAQNPSTGAIAALTSAFGTDNGLAGLCFTAVGQPLPLPLTWTTPGVDASWRIVSVAYEPGIQQFVATANREGEVATTLMACA